MSKYRPGEIGRGALYALLLDLAWVGLTLLVPGLAWVLVLVWAMLVLVVTGISIAEERYGLTIGFWLMQMAMFTLWLLVYMGALSFLGRLGAGG